LQVPELVQFRISNYLRRLAPLIHRLDRIQKELARRDDGFVRRNEMFVGPVFHRSLALCSKGIVSLKIKTHAGKGLRLHGVAVLLISAGRVARDSGIRRQLGTAVISYVSG